jgi:hypothetical protein
MMKRIEDELRGAKPGETICCDKCGAVGLLVDSGTEGATRIVDWRCAYCGDTWFTGDSHRAACRS